MTFRTCRTVRKCGAALCGRTIPHRNFFIAILDELGNFKPFEPYLFFWSKVRPSAAECGRTVRVGAAECGWARPSSAECGKGLETLKGAKIAFFQFMIQVAPS